MGYGAKLRDFRKKLGLTLEDISQKTGFTKSFISQIENGKNSPSISSLKKICYALGTTISELFEDERNIVHVFKENDYKKLDNKNLNMVFLASKLLNRKLEPMIIEFLHMLKQARIFINIQVRNSDIFLKENLLLLLARKNMC